MNELLDSTKYENWTNFVVILDAKNWIEALTSLYRSIDKNRLPHFRFSHDGRNVGVAIRFLGKAESEVIREMENTCATLEIKYSINPKLKKDKMFSKLSGWFDKPEYYNWTNEWVKVLHSLSESAFLAISSGFSSSSSRSARRTPRPRGG